jgi:outer membrane translocation and assembly module TamA
VFQSSRISPEALADLSLRPQLIALGLDPRDGGQDGTLNVISLDIRRNTAQPNPLNAIRGYSVDVHFERAGFFGSYEYTNASFDARHYLRVPLGRRGVILATRVQAGSIAPDGGAPDRVPFAKRYFLGGSTSLRGWGRYEVSPLSMSGLPLGGFSMFQASVEARIRLFGQLGAVVFLDAGNVWEDEWRLRPNDLRYAAGPGLRYLTPVGPIRVDLGYQLNPIPGLLVDGQPEGRRWRAHFSIGQAF